MGRHSAPEQITDDTGGDVGGGAGVAVETRVRGRHARPDDGAGPDRSVDLAPSVDHDQRGAAGRPVDERPVEERPVEEQHTQLIAAVDPALALDDADARHTDTLSISEIAGQAPAEATTEPAPAEPAPAEAAPAEAAPAEAAPAEVDGPAAGALSPGGQAVPARRESGTRADLRLLRESPALRLRCLGGVVVAFAIYTLVILLLGRADAYLMWLWTPIVVSGVLVGALLDLAHRRAEQRSGGAARG